MRYLRFVLVSRGDCGMSLLPDRTNSASYNITEQYNLDSIWSTMTYRVTVLSVPQPFL